MQGGEKKSNESRRQEYPLFFIKYFGTRMKTDGGIFPLPEFAEHFKTNLREARSKTQITPLLNVALPPGVVVVRQPLLLLLLLPGDGGR